MENIIIVLGPLVVTLLTTIAKSLVPVIANAGATNLRLLVVLLAFATTLVQAAMAGDVSGIEVAAVTVVNALGAIGTYSLTKKTTTYSKD